MKKITDLKLNTPGGTDQVERGEVEIDKGTKLMGLRLVVALKIAKADAGTTTLSTEDKQKLLSLLSIELLDYGRDGKFAQPYVSRSFDEIRRHAIRCYLVQMIGWTDSTNGLAKTIAASSSTAVQFELLLPLGKWAAFEGKATNRWGMGRSQAKTLGVKMKRATDGTIRAGLTIDATEPVLIDVYDDAQPCSGDPWNPVPHLHRFEDTRLSVPLLGGLPLAIEEVTDPAADIGLTNISVKLDDLYLARQVDAERIVTAALLESRRPPAVLVTLYNEVTPLFDAAIGEVQFDQMLTGKPTIVQEGNRQKATLDLMYTYIPIVQPDALAAEVAQVAVHIRDKDINAISGARFRKEDLPSRLMPYAGLQLTDRDDREFETFPGLLALRDKPGAPAQPHVPTSIFERARHAVKMHENAGEKLAAKKVLDELSASVPGAVTTTRGFEGGTSTIRATIAAKL